MAKRIGIWIKSQVSKPSWMTLLTLGLICIILGALISIPIIPKPTIAKITIDAPIMSQSYTDDILKMIKYARDEGSIKGVVLQINSPGGVVSLIEQVYLELLQLREKKPVITSVGGQALSGGYYIAVASNFIYAQSSSLIGNIGATAKLPKPEELKEDIAHTGPFKTTGASERKVMTILERIKQDFLLAVISQRGERLKISKDELSKAEIYTGIEALRYGLIDEIGTINTAIEKTANLIRVRNYSLVNVNEKLGVRKPFVFIFGSLTSEGLKSETGPGPIYYYLYFEKEAEE